MSSSPSSDEAVQPPDRNSATAGGRAMPIFRNALSSSMGATVVATVVTPLDVVKVRLQAHVCPVAGSNPCGDPLHVEGSFDAARKIVRQDGIRGLWRGLNVTLLLVIPTTGMYFTLYEAFREQIQLWHPDMSDTSSALLAGATARTATVTTASPLELARTSLQAGVGGPNATVTSVLRQIARSSGIGAWWRGLAPTLMRDAPFSAIYWSAYESLKDPKRSILPHRLFASRSEFGVYLGAGIGAGGLAALCTVPADVVKTRRQALMAPAVASVRGRAPNMGSIVIARQILETDGLRGLFRGAGPRVAKLAPASAIMMGSYEFFRNLLGLERKA
ncbi:Solute carrier family 25 member 40 [Gracilariopsis chorda]|uniref:Solute carrier family 25 member 40 n=1 Tax=Gracilariopsis chorda TaxID=448386 RepID=A0A2V3J4I0_9FLOR|nr:Solute carrier family 25 member 40 [Gracilariopsis chorda]|eukprot:PXF49295.1 Solute carrier family 25 member 40 [Gracilariopsis chorda]